MKILIGTEDTCGLINVYAEGFKNNGHSVTTIGKGYLFEDQRYDLRRDYLLYDYTSSRHGNSLFCKIKTKQFEILNKYFNGLGIKIIKKKLIQEHDLFINIWRGLNDDESDLPLFKYYNKKVVSLFMGSDVRYFPAFKQEYNINHWKFPHEFEKQNIEDKLHKLRLHEKYSDIIFSLPDQAGLGLRPYHHIFIPLDINRFKFKIPNHPHPLIIHAPSEPYQKGTDIIENAIYELKEEGLDFEFKSVRKIPHQKLLRLLSETDILIDEIVYHGPGVLSLEAMASGCLVATKVDNLSNSFINPPVININNYNIKSKIREILLNKELRIELAHKGRKYVEENHSNIAITEKILTLLKNNSENCDYYPNFLNMKYLPNSKYEINSINKWNSFVKDEKWYKINIKSGKRDGLIF